MATLTGGVGFAMDAVAIWRTGSTTDAEGNAVDAIGQAPVWSGRGTWGMATHKDAILAETRGDVVNAVLSIPTGVSVFLDDRVDVRGQRYAVTTIADVRLGQRLTLRLVGK